MILKLTALLLLACVADLALRSGSAALRHLMWTFTLVAALLLPLGNLAVERLPYTPPALHTTIVAEPSALLAPAKFAWLLSIYAVGAAFLLLRLALDVLAANRLVRRSRPSSQSGVRVSDEAIVPFAWRQIIVPAGWEDCASIVAHEAEHIARQDWAAILLARVTCAIYWFHPLPWYALAKIRLEADLACDDAVLRRGFPVESYAAVLVTIARDLRAGNLAPAAIHPSQLELRVRHILAPAADRRKLHVSMICAMAVACLAIAYPLATLVLGRSSHIYKMGPLVKPPSVLRKIDPEYTRQARDAKISGTVLVSLVVGADGRAHDMAVTHKLNPGLDAKALEAIRQWRFRPGTKSGQPVDVRANIEVNFRLK